MAWPRSVTSTRRAKAALAAGLYAVLGLAWLRGSDWLLHQLNLPWLESWLDLTLVVATAVALLVLLRRYGKTAAPRLRPTVVPPAPANDTDAPRLSRG